MSQIFDTGLLHATEYHDFEDMADTVASKWDQRYRRLVGNTDYGFAHQLNLQKAQLTHIGWQPGIRIETGTPRDSIGFVHQLKGEGRMRVNGVRLREGEIAMMQFPLDYDLVNPVDTQYLVLAVDKNLVLKQFEALFGTDPQGFESKSKLQIRSRIQQKQLELFFRQQLQLADECPVQFSDPLSQALMVDELLDVLFLSSRRPSSGKSPANRHKLAQLAARYLDDNLDKVLTLRSLCEHLCVSERCLRQGFLERFGVTPKAYIKQHRLRKLNRVLRASEPDDMTVTQAALSCGLTHLGRTSAEYRTLFGELPSRTLETPAV